MACQQLIAHVRAAATYIEATSETQRPAAVASQLAAVRMMLARIFGPAEALQASMAISSALGSFLSRSQHEEITALINAQAAVGVPSTARNQEWSSEFWVELPRSLKDTLSDNSMASSPRMDALFQYLAGRGLRVPSEKTYGSMLALYYYCSNNQLEGGVQLLASISHLKTAWRSFIQAYKDALIGVDNPSWNWPGVPVGEPCERLEKVRFLAIFHMIPLRSSSLRASAEGELHLAPARGSQRCMPMGAQMQIQMQRPPLALANGPIVSSGNGMDSMVSSMGSMGGMEQSQTTALAVMGVAPPGSAANAGRSAGLGTDAPEGPPAGPAGSGGGTRKSLAEVTAELMLQPSVLKKPAAALKKRPAAAGMKRPAAAIADDSDDEETAEADGAADSDNDDDDGSDGAADDAAAARPLAMPAAKAVAKQRAQAKAVAKAVAKQRARPPADVWLQMRNGSAAVRARLYMQWGCPKCRWKPTCSDSCWRYRGMARPVPVPVPAPAGEDVN